MNRKTGGRMFASVAIIAALLTPFIGGLVQFPTVLLQASSGLQHLITSGVASWTGVAAVIIILIMAIAGLVYMLSSTINSNNGRRWAKIQVFQGFVALFFIFIFLTLASLMFGNPQSTFGGAGVVPPTCTSTDSIFTLASCNIATFLIISSSIFQLFSYASYLCGLVPGFSLTVSVPSTIGLSLGTSLPSILPRSAEEYLSVMMDFLLFAIMLNQLQMLMIAVAPLLFSILITIGLLAWAAGFSRSFGGAMIAFAIGLGILYPILVSLTYGFINTSILASLSSLGPGISVSQIVNLGVSILSLLSVFASNLVSAFLLGEFTPQLATILIEYGYIFAGLTFIPFLNFMVLDAFVSDFSKLMGERMSFMSLLGNLV